MAETDIFKGLQIFAELAEDIVRPRSPGMSPIGLARDAHASIPDAKCPLADQKLPLFRKKETIWVGWLYGGTRPTSIARAR
jgi:hypothetical protein